jgi:enamine deaminase RidA (YjgF/YER057c/UK114 family)
MKIERMEVGPRLSDIVIHGDTVYLAGMVPEETVNKGMREQTAEVLRSIDEYLAKAGTDKTRLLQAVIYITDMSQFGEMIAAWEAWVSPGNTPARATVEVKSLANPAFKVEIMVTAAR